MAKRKIDKNLLKTIQLYLDKVGEFYKIDDAVIFGSYAKGTQSKDSDIDLAIISSDVKDRIIDMGKMFALTWKINTDIEPYPINTEDYKNCATPFINEIIRTGIPVYA